MTSTGFEVCLPTIFIEDQTNLCGRDGTFLARIDILEPLDGSVSSKALVLNKPWSQVEAVHKKYALIMQHDMAKDDVNRIAEFLRMLKT